MGDEILSDMLIVDHSQGKIIEHDVRMFFEDLIERFDDSRVGIGGVSHTSSGRPEWFIGMYHFCPAKSAR